MKEFNKLVTDYAQRIANGKSVPFAERIKGAIEIESASAKTEAETRRFFNAQDVRTDYDPSIRTPRACFPNKVELHVDFENANIERVLDVANQFANFSTANSASGIHIHVNASKLVGNLERASSIARLARLKACLTSNAKRWENLLMGMNGARRRENNAHVDYMTQYEFEQAQEIATPNRYIAPTLRDCASGQKYKLINFTNLNNTDYNPNARTIEFRAWSASKGCDESDFQPTSALHVESAFFVLVNLLSTALSELGKVDRLRFTPKHSRAFDSFKWFLHHCAKRSQLPMWKDAQRVEQVIRYIFSQCHDYDVL